MNTKYFKLSRSLFISTAIALLIAIAASPFSVFAKECRQIRSEVLRLHIVAHDNSGEAQRLKLLVRDKVQSIENELFCNVNSELQAKQIAEENIEYIKETVSEHIAFLGFTTPVKAEVCKMFFATREYDGFTMPAGKYDALRITLGDGKGDNWWCVLYPALCVPAAAKKESLDVALTEAQQQLIKNKTGYEIRFATLELFEKLKQLLFD